ncbi:MAG: ATP-dependent protease ATPase subunit HslU [Fimbriimonadaceae bacterium]|nr:ATP-dependent protease ATPase subunit HslU [Fimbriimonadaceae bacterium]QYK57145.1 MAG: ATP-dependent protease ATPase subunit HslU [Fimbriimonadaceae bacterium]
MSLPIEDLTPRQIVKELDKYIVGQAAAKRAVAVALRNRYRRQRVDPKQREDILPKNILMMGPTGVGKTEIARRLAQLARAPFIKIEATKFTEVGYVGRDVESMVRDLVGSAVRLVENEKIEAVRPQAEEAAIDRLVELLDKNPHPAYAIFGEPGEQEDYAQMEAEMEQRRAELRQAILRGEHDSTLIEVETEDAGSGFIQMFTPQGMEEIGVDNLPFNQSTKYVRTKMTVREAKEFLVDAEARRFLDRTSVNREAVRRTEQTGIIFLDEIDKIGAKGGGSGPEVSREGVQRDLLPIIEGSTVPTKFGPVRTDHVLFICAGAFHMSKPSDLIPELQGRLPIRVELDPLNQEDFRRILLEPQNAITRQYQLLLAVEGVDLTFTDDALSEIALFAAAVNEKAENIGARRLHTMLERLLEPEMFDAPECGAKRIDVDKAMVEERLGPVMKDLQLSQTVV